ncbi:hypothetical protein ACNI3K_07465 [Demequina sp. SO4-13]|uniref:hypothetical protein n=1 Tax=Demequina sp. SO4-13 TaxID=3401027 RepID=UPI003AF5C9D9
MTAPLLRASAVAVAVLSLAACSWRVETPPPEWPSPGPVTQMRDAAAEREQAVLDATGHGAGAAGATTAQASVLSEIEAGATQERLDALGGLYVPYPDQSPSPSSSGEPRDLIALAMSARDGHLADARVAEDPDLAFLLSSAGLSHALSSWYAGWVADAITESTQPIVAERTIRSDELATDQPAPATTSVDPDVVAELAVMHDQAGYAYEVLAARSADAERDQWIARRDIHRDRAAALTQLPGVEDRRDAVYSLPGDGTAGSAARAATAVDLETHAAQTYAGMLDGAAAADLPWLLNAAFDAYAQAAAFGEPTAESFAVPALPGAVPTD